MFCVLSVVQLYVVRWLSLSYLNFKIYSVSFFSLYTFITLSLFLFQTLSFSQSMYLLYLFFSFYHSLICFFSIFYSIVFYCFLFFPFLLFFIFFFCFPIFLETGCSNNHLTTLEPPQDHLVSTQFQPRTSKEQPQDQPRTTPYRNNKWSKKSIKKFK